MDEEKIAQTERGIVELLVVVQNLEVERIIPTSINIMGRRRRENGMGTMERKLYHH